MQTYPYIVQPTPNGSAHMPRAAYRGTKTKADILAEITARIGTTPLTAELIIHTYLEVVIDFCKQGWKVEEFDGLMGFRFTCGKAHPDTGFPGTYDGLGIKPSCNLGEEGDLRARDEFSGEKIGEQGRATLVYVRVEDTASGLPDHYTVDRTLEVEVSNKRIAYDRDNTGHHIRFRKADGTFVLSPEVILRGRIFSIRVPTGLTGSVELYIACEVNGSIRTSVYQNPLLT